MYVYVYETGMPAFINANIGLAIFACENTSNFTAYVYLLG
jgi:hypothetical protein